MLLACSNVRVCSQQVPILDGSEAERKEAGFIVDRLDLFHEALEAMHYELNSVSCSSFNNIGSLLSEQK